jgi:hypothetical protein
MIRKVFGPKEEELIKRYRILHNEESLDLYRSPFSVKIVKSCREGHMASMGETRNAYTIFVM